MWVEGGYLGGLDIELAPGGNVACGGPGVGKSTSLALIRFCLALVIPPTKRAEFEALIARNLGAGRVYLALVTAQGIEYIVSRAGGDAAPRVDSPKSAAGERFSPDLFPVRFVGHGEFELMATDGLARLELVERFAWDESRRLRTELARVRQELDDNAAPLLRLDKEMAALAEKCAALPSERAKLEAIKKAAGLDPAHLERANRGSAARQRERMTLEAAQQGVDWLARELGVFVASAKRRLAPALDSGVTTDADETGAKVLAEVSARVLATTLALESMSARVAAECVATHATIADRGSVLAERHAVEDDAYRALLATHEHDRGRAFERLGLEKSVTALMMAADDRAARAEERRQITAARNALRARVRALVAERAALLERTAVRITETLESRVRVTMVPEADRTAYRALLVELLKGKRFEKETIDVVVAAIRPEELCDHALRGDAARIEEKIGSRATALRLVSVLIDSPRVYELETVDVLGLPQIELLDGENYKPSHELSSGQRTVCFVSIILLDRSGPLIADQPEDNLANAYLARFLCAFLAKIQDDLQFIFVTHNGNIPILGRVRRVFEFQADGKRGWVSAQGDAESVIEPMANNFEGGRGAFVARRDFYGIG